MFDVKETAVKETTVVERSPDLYTVTLPPGMLICTNQAGAMRLLNRARVTIWNYVKDGRLRSFNVSGNVAIPLVDIAGMLNMTETELYNVAIAYKLPLWQIHLEEG